MKDQLIAGLKEIRPLFEEADGIWINLQGKEREKQKEKCKKENKKFEAKTELKLHIQINNSFVNKILKYEEISELKTMF